MLGGYGNRRKCFKHANTLKMLMLEDLLVIYANCYSIIGSTFLLTMISITLDHSTHFLLKDSKIINSQLT